MNKTTQKKIDPSLSVEFVEEQLSQNDMNDLCDATDAAIEAGGGFGWIELPSREILETYWRGVVTAPMRELFVARIDGVICGTTQVILPPKNNEAQGHIVVLTTNFVAPWARGYGLAKMLLEDVERKMGRDGYAVVNLDVREGMDSAISLYEAMGYQQFGKHPYSVRVKGKTIESLHYYKLINPSYFD